MHSQVIEIMQKQSLLNINTIEDIFYFMKQNLEVTRINISQKIIIKKKGVIKT